MSRRARRRTPALLAAATAIAAALGGCPLPQPLAEVQRVDGGSIAPPRILVSTAQPAQTRIGVSRSCPGTPTFQLQAQVDDPDVIEPVEARWFVDYDAATNTNTGIQRLDSIPGTGDPAVTARPTPTTFVYFVPPPDPANTAHVVEVVVSNGFSPAGVAVPLPNRTAADGFETQVFRWVFQYVDVEGRCQFP